jgi:hypothetical protein
MKAEMEAGPSLHDRACGTNFAGVSLHAKNVRKNHEYHVRCRASGTQRSGASRPVAWRERPAPAASGRDHTREPEAPATTRQKPPGRVAGASRSRCLRSRPYTGAGGSRHDAAEAVRSRGGSVPLPLPPVETIHGSRRLPPRREASRPVLGDPVRFACGVACRVARRRVS